MTAIAFRDGVLVVDTEVSAGDVKIGSCEKFYRDPKDRFFVAGCGTLTYVQEYLKWFADGQKGDRPSCNDDTQIFVFHCDGAVEKYSTHGKERVVAEFMVAGCAEDFLRGALFTGASPREAVMAACEYVHGCSFPLHVLEFGVPGVAMITRSSKYVEEKGRV